MKPIIPDILVAPWISSVISTAIRLKIFSIISNKKMKPKEIASQCNAVTQRIKILLDACVSMWLLETDNEKYWNSEFSKKYFCEGQEFYVGDFIKLVDDESKDWFKLPDIILGKEKEIQDGNERKTDYKIYITAMNNIGQLGEANALSKAVDLSKCKYMVDAGGGSGLYSITLCRKFPQLRSTIFDMKQTLEVTKDIIADKSERKQITLKEGDFLKDSLGQNVDVVLFSDVLYIKGKAKVALENAWNSLTKDGLVIIRGYYADPENTKLLFGALFAVKEIIDEPEQKTMTYTEVEETIADSGFAVIKSEQLAKNSFIIIGKKQLK